MSFIRPIYDEAMLRAKVLRVASNFKLTERITEQELINRLNSTSINAKKNVSRKSTVTVKYVY